MVCIQAQLYHDFLESSWLPFDLSGGSPNLFIRRTFGGWHMHLSIHQVMWFLSSLCLSVGVVIGLGTFYDMRSMVHTFSHALAFFLEMQHRLSNLLGGPIGFPCRMNVGIKWAFLHSFNGLTFGSLAFSHLHGHDGFLWRSHDLSVVGDLMTCLMAQFWQVYPKGARWLFDLSGGCKVFIIEWCLASNEHLSIHSIPIVKSNSPPR